MKELSLEEREREIERERGGGRGERLERLPFATGNARCRLARTTPSCRPAAWDAIFPNMLLPGGPEYRHEWSDGS